MMEEFFNEFRRVVRPSGRWSSWSPYQFVDGWRTFVGEVRDGWTEDYYDYENDLFIRDCLQAALDHDGLNSWDAWQQLRTQIEGIDNDFREVLAEGPLVKPDAQWWWRARLPPRAGEDFVEEVERIFKVKLALVD